MGAEVEELLGVNLILGAAGPVQGCTWTNLLVNFIYESSSVLKSEQLEVKPLICLLLIALSVKVQIAGADSTTTMLNTNITLLEYIKLNARFIGIERAVSEKTTKWNGYESVVGFDVSFDAREKELNIVLDPTISPSFQTIADAKEYCTQLIQAERLEAIILLSFGWRPNGWGNVGLNKEDFSENLLLSSKITTRVGENQILESFPRKAYFLNCEASINGAGEIIRWSYNL